MTAAPPLNIVILGPPGAGKGTQAERFARAHGVPRVSTGDILRDALQQGTPIGLLARATMEAGQLVRDDVMIGIVQERLDRPDARPGFVLDGFPRTIPQATALDALVRDRGGLVVVNIEVPETELVRRLAARRICAQCGAIADGADGPGAATCGRCGGVLVQRSDDSEPVVRERLRVYARDTQPLVDYYRAQPTFRSINGARPPDQVAADIRDAVLSAAGTLARRGDGARAGSEGSAGAPQ